jgi:hypothetical protein
LVIIHDWNRDVLITIIKYYQSSDLKISKFQEVQILFLGLLAPGCPHPAIRFPRRFAPPLGARTAPNVTSIEKRGGVSGWPTGTGRRRRHRGDAAKGEEERRNTSSTFETSKCNTCNIYMKADETLKKNT